MSSRLCDKITILSKTIELSPPTPLHDAITQLTWVLKHSKLTTKLHFHNPHRPRYHPTQYLLSANHINDDSSKKQTRDKLLHGKHAER